MLCFKAGRRYKTIMTEFVFSSGTAKGKHLVLSRSHCDAYRLQSSIADNCWGDAKRLVLLSFDIIKHYPVKAKSVVLTLAGMKAGKQKKPRRGSVVK